MKPANITLTFTAYRWAWLAKIACWCLNRCGRHAWIVGGRR